MAAVAQYYNPVVNLVSEITLGLPHFMQQRREHLNKAGTARQGREEVGVGVQLDHALPFPQERSGPKAIRRETAIRPPSQADVPFEPAAEKHRIQIAERLDGEIRAPKLPTGVLDSRPQTADGLLFAR